MALPFVHDPPFNIYSFWGIVWAHLASHAIAVKVMLLTPTFRNLDSALEEASRTVGAGRLRTLVGIVLPVTLPALLAILLLAMIRAMQSFEIELVLGPPFHFYVYSTLVYTFIFAFGIFYIYRLLRAGPGEAVVGTSQRAFPNRPMSLADDGPTPPGSYVGAGE